MAFVVCDDNDAHTPLKGRNYRLELYEKNIKFEWMYL